MAEMPVDVIRRHYAALDIPFDMEKALLLDEELQKKFMFFAMAEAAAVKIESIGRGYLRAGSGPEEVTCSRTSNPNWLLNRALNDIALALRLRQLESGSFAPFPTRPIVAAAEIKELIEEAQRPAAKAWVDGDDTDITIRADNNPMLWYVGTDQQAYRLDQSNPGDTFPLRERQIALALIDLSANALRDQTL